MLAPDFSDITAAIHGKYAHARRNIYIYICRYDDDIYYNINDRAYIGV